MNGKKVWCKGRRVDWYLGGSWVKSSWQHFENFYFLFLQILPIFIILNRNKYMYLLVLQWKIFFPSAAGWIRTADLQGGWMYSEHRRLNAAPGITHQCGSHWNTKVKCDTSTIKWCLRPGPLPTKHFLVLYSTCS